MKPQRLIPVLGLLLLWSLVLDLFPEQVAPAQVTEKVASRLPQQVAELISQPRYRHARWGILAVELPSGETLAELNADERFAPASVTKLFTVAALWHRIGPDYRYRTTVYADGEIEQDGTLRGNLVLYPQGDLTLGGRTLPDGTLEVTNSDHTYASGSSRTQLTRTDPLQGLRQLARQVRDQGVTRVAGDVLVDDRYFEPAESTGSGPRRVTPVMLNDNLIDIVVHPTRPGEVARIEYRPDVPGLVLDNRVRTVASDRATHVTLRRYGDLRLQILGTIAAERNPIVLVYEVPDPASFARAAFIQCLRQAGIDVDVSPLDVNRRELLPREQERSDCPVVATLMGPPFSEEARLILKVSHNLHASALPLLLALQEGMRDLQSGLRIEGRMLRELKVPIDQISLGSGAGGARVDLVTPTATVALLRTFYERDDFERFRNCLPVLGVDGTLHDHIDADSPAAGKVYAKTGTYYLFNPLLGRHMLTSKALAGYTETASGRTIAFAVFVNNVDLRDLNTTEIGKDLARVAEAFYSHY